MEKQAPLVPESIRAESSFNSLLFISPPSWLQNACLAPRDAFMTVPYMSYLVFIPNYHAIHTIHYQINLAVNGIWLLRQKTISLHQVIVFCYLYSFAGSIQLKIKIRSSTDYQYCFLSTG